MLQSYLHKKGKIWRRLTTTTSTQRQIQIPCTSCKPICFVSVFCPLFYIYTYFFIFILLYLNHTNCFAWYFRYTYIPQDFPQTEPRELTDQVISSIDTPQYKVFEKKKVWLPKKLATSVLTEFHNEKLYFVWKIVVTFCEKKLFYWSRKTFEIWGWRVFSEDRKFSKMLSF